MPRDKTSLDGTAWKDLLNMETAKRRESATGADARNRNTYSQVNSPKAKNKSKKIIPTDPSTLSLLSVPCPGESEEEILSRIKMSKGEEKPVGEANQTKAADLLDLPLIYILIVLLGLRLDNRHTRVRDILYANECDTWKLFDTRCFEF